jgi:hypothetical protein
MSICTICHDESAELFYTRCNHTYHVECFTRWVSVHQRCCVCRRPVGTLYPMMHEAGEPASDVESSASESDSEADSASEVDESDGSDGSYESDASNESKSDIDPVGEPPANIPLGELDISNNTPDKDELKRQISQFEDALLDFLAASAEHMPMAMLMYAKIMTKMRAAIQK